MQLYLQFRYMLSRTEYWENDREEKLFFKDQTPQLKYVTFIHSLGARLSVVPREPWPRMTKH